MENVKKLKPITFFKSFEEQQAYGRQASLNATYAQRINEMYRLNLSIFGDSYGKLSKTIEIYVARPEETLDEFYKRINNG